ncbi:MAG: exopolysaccharide biosynthesis polyprenyl glycosylphosphotransferase [Prolixibacteraceae bacterium]|jgi:putative colanic acid biosynthesis UDP-glucose lipid carrier transferase|nr:exopolysaccharide biosynthesis polyprenyl glycosylphosphotransferase [Prolixibacteraceae bacterium]
MLQQIINSNYSLGYQFAGFAAFGNSKHPQLLGAAENMAQLIQQNNIQMVWATLSMDNTPDQLKEQLKICNQLGIRLRFIHENQQHVRFKSNSESLGELILNNPQEIPLDHLGSRVGKRIFDIGFSLAAILLIFSWLFPILALLIKISSKAPVFFLQKRTGINNKTFTCIKFRSMKVNGQSDHQQARVNDNSITRIGLFMRKTNMDELPQFFNVLMSQMSVVGPRPHMLKHTEQYSKLIDHYLIRHYVKLGITGWAQVNGYRGETKELWKMEKRVKYDLKYMETWSFNLDLKIILMTIFGIKSYSNAG